MNTPNLKKRGQTYYVRVAVPRPLWAALGRREIVRTLGTGSLPEANRRKHAVIAEIRALIEDAHRAYGPASGSPVERVLSDLRTLRRQHRMQLVTTTEADLNKDALVDQLEALEERDQIPPARLPAIRAAVSAVTDPSITTLADAVETYLSHHKPPLVTQQTYRTKQRRLQELRDSIGPDLPVREVTGQRAAAFVTGDLLRRGLSPKTCTDYIADCSAFFEWCILQDLTAANPFHRKSKLVRRPKRGTKDLGPRIWTPEELQAFARGCPADHPQHLLPFFALALFTGCRLNELAELKVADVHGDWFEVTAAKTKAGLRSVPIHSQLQPLVGRLVTSSADGYLLPGLRRGGEDQKRGHYVSKAFTTIRRRLGITDPGTRFHSLRANFITSLERAGVPVSTIQSLVGHERPELALNTYSAGPGMEVLREAIERVDYGETLCDLLRSRLPGLLD